MSRSEAAADGAPTEFPLHEAAGMGDLDKVRLLLSEGTCVDARNKDGCTPLYCAAKRNQLEIAETLLEWGADVNSEQELGSTPLHEASCYADIELVEMLIRNGACVNKESQIGHTPLSWAVMRNRSRIAETLIEMGADVSTGHGIVGTPLHLAVYRNTDMELVKMLIRNGACVNEEDQIGHTPLSVAVMLNKSRIAESLIEMGADVSAGHGIVGVPIHLAVSHNTDIELIKMLIRNGACVNEESQIGHTPLSLAVMLNRSRIAESLVEMGADVSAGHGIVGAPLHMAVAGNTDIELVKMLLAKGADVNSNVSFLNGFTPLIEAVRSNKLHFTELLLEWGADINVESETGRTPFDFTVSNEVELTIKRHVVKLKSANVHVSDKLLRAVSGDDELASFQRECEEEVERMKNDIVCRGLSFFDMLTKNTTRLARLYARNENFVRDFKSVDLDAEFPNYGRILNVRFNAFSGRKESLERGSEFFNVLPRLPQDCISDILDYLSSKDLMNCYEICYK